MTPLPTPPIPSTSSTPSSLRRYLRHGMLPQLATFEAVLRLHGTTRAAEALCIAQPTLSGHLRKLGETLGVTLFKMRGKRLVPTDAALVLLQASREVFAAFERCEALLAGRRDDRSAPLADTTDTAGAAVIVVPRSDALSSVRTAADRAPVPTARPATERRHRSRSPRRAESRPASSFIMQPTLASGSGAAAYTAADLAAHGRAVRGPGRKERTAWVISQATAGSG